MSRPIKTKFRRIDDLSIRYAESDTREVSAILLSPWPENLFTFEQMWSRLADHAHLVAVDLPGFGHSDKAFLGMLNGENLGKALIRLS